MLARSVASASSALARRRLINVNNTNGRRLYSDLADTAEGRAIAGKNAELWRKLSLYVALPVVAIFGYRSYHQAKEHEEHTLAHPPTFPGFAYMRIRNKPFPWGNESLFDHPINNPKPTEE